MTDVPTRLIVRADGALQVLDQFERKMGDAGKATDRAQGAVASFEARMVAARKAIEAGNAVSTQTVARRSAEQRAYDNLASSVDKSVALRIRLEREAERAAVAAANAVNMGYVSQEQALTTLVALEQRHATQLAQAAAANDNLASSYRNSAAAADEAASASVRANAARTAGGAGANTAHSTNLLFQAQDIAMMTLLGQSPGMLALQQGMQVGGIFHQMGSGKAIVQGLGAAVAGLLNPLNLATIATIGLGAAGVQWFMSTLGATEDATTALERHSEWLDEVLAGYGKVKDAADDALDAALKLPQSSVESNLATRQEEAAVRAAAAMEKVIALQTDFQAYAGYSEAFGVPPEIAASLENVSQLIQQVTADSKLSGQELDILHTTFTRLANNTADQVIKGIASEALALVDAARSANAEVSSLDAGLRALPTDIQIKISMSQEYGSAFAELQGLYQDPRSRFDQMREQAKNAADQAMATAVSYGQAVGAASEYERVLASIDAAEAAASEKANARGARAAQKPFDQWGGNVEQFQQRIASQRLEMDLLGKSTYEIERQRAAFDLLNQAKQAGLPITSQVTEQINLMSAEYAASTVELMRMQEQQQRINQMNSALASGFSDMFKSLLKGTTSLTDALGNLLGRLGDLFIDQAFGMLFGGIGGGLGLGGGGGLFGGAIIPGILHTGGTAGVNGYNHGRQFSPAVWVNAPRYHNGGIAGLKPDEVPAILRRGEPVFRDWNHAMQATGAANQNGGDIYISNQINVPPGTSADVAPAIAREVTKELRKQLPDAIERHNRNPLRRAG